MTHDSATLESLTKKFKLQEFLKIQRLFADFWRFGNWCCLPQNDFCLPLNVASCHSKQFVIDKNRFLLNCKNEFHETAKPATALT